MQLFCTIVLPKENIADILRNSSTCTSSFSSKQGSTGHAIIPDTAGDVPLADCSSPGLHADNDKSREEGKHGETNRSWGESPGLRRPLHSYHTVVLCQASRSLPDFTERSERMTMYRPRFLYSHWTVFTLCTKNTRTRVAWPQLARAKHASVL